MPRSTRTAVLSAPLVLLAVMPAVSTCVFPSDESNSATVEILVPTTNVVRGESFVARARAVRVSGEDTRPVEAGSFQWSSGNEGIFSVLPQTDGSAVVTGVNTGRASLYAVAKDFAGAPRGEVQVRVTNTVEIDSVKPDTVRYGEQVEIFGVGLGRLARVALGETALLPDSASFSGDPRGEGRQRFWVGFPAETGAVLAVASEGFSAPAAKPTVVIPRNVYRAADESPAVINLDGPAILPGRVLFHNPALALTPGVEVDVYDFVLSDTTRGLTISVSTTSSVVTDIDPIIAVPGDLTRFPLSSTGWAVGVSHQFCKGNDLVSSPGQAFGSNPATVTRSIQQMPGRSVSLRISGQSPGRYAVTVIEGYAAPDERIAPDRFEENDHCVGADLNADLPSHQLDVDAGFAEELTIDQPYDIDWYRFTVPPSSDGDQLITVRTASLPFAAADSSNLGVALISRDELEFFEEPWRAEAHTPGSAERISIEVEPGDYYLAAFDEAGVATRYSLCIRLGADCSPSGLTRGAFPTPPR